MNMRIIFGEDLGIDLGTANTLVYVMHKGIILREPSVVAVERGSNKVLAVGIAAKRMIGRAPINIEVIRPIRDGVITDFSITRSMLQYFLSRVRNRFAIFRRPRVVICVPSGVTEVERRAVIEVVKEAGVRQAYLVEEPIAAAIGAGLPIHEPVGNMVVDVGGGTTEVAVISLGGIVVDRSIRTAGDEMDEAIVSYLKKNCNFLIGLHSAEEIKFKIGTACRQRDGDMSMEVKGRDMVEGLPKTIEITESQIREALREPINAIVEAVRVTLENTPPELAADITTRGLVMAGGGSLLKGLDILLVREMGIPVIVAEDPLSCVAYGAGKVLDNPKALRSIYNRGELISKGKR